MAYKVQFLHAPGRVKFWTLATRNLRSARDACYRGAGGDCFSLTPVRASAPASCAGRYGPQGWDAQFDRRSLSEGVRGEFSPAAAGDDQGEVSRRRGVRGRAHIDFWSANLAGMKKLTSQGFKMYEVASDMPLLEMLEYGSTRGHHVTILFIGVSAPSSLLSPTSLHRYNTNVNHPDYNESWFDKRMVGFEDMPRRRLLLLDGAHERHSSACQCNGAWRLDRVCVEPLSGVGRRSATRRSRRPPPPSFAPTRWATCVRIWRRLCPGCVATGPRAP